MEEVCIFVGLYVAKGGRIGHDSHFPPEFSFLPFCYSEIEKDTRDQLIDFRLVLEKELSLEIVINFLNRNYISGIF